jgi:hypothetical protein
MISFVNNASADVMADEEGDSADEEELIPEADILNEDVYVVRVALAGKKTRCLDIILMRYCS